MNCKNDSVYIIFLLIVSCVWVSGVQLGATQFWPIFLTKVSELD